VELLGCKPEHYLYLSPIGQELINNRHLFLSKKCIYSFGGYANQQLRRLDNKANRLVSQSEQEQHILKSIEHASVTFKERYFTTDSDAIKLYIDKSDREEYDTEIFMDVNLTHYPLRDYKSMWSDMNTIVKDYSKFGKRNQNAIEHGKLAKHMMHLVRLFLMCLDILNNGEINTYRDKDHDFLMSIRNGKYLDDNRQPTAEFFDIVTDLENQLKIAKEKTKLPDLPDYKRINEFMISVNDRVVRGEI
jgi:predicted nucleotidyltransferase